MMELADCLSIEHRVAVIFDRQIEEYQGIAILADYRGLILVDPNLPAIDRFLIMLHEVGHLFALRGSAGKRTLRLRKRPGSEYAANTTACRIIAEIEDLEPENRLQLIRFFRDRYNKANRPGVHAGVRQYFKPKMSRYKKIAMRPI